MKTQTAKTPEELAAKRITVLAMNDYPHAVYTDSEQADRIVAARTADENQLEAEARDNPRHYSDRRRKYWHTHSVPLVECGNQLLLDARDRADESIIVGAMHSFYLATKDTAADKQYRRLSSALYGLKIDRVLFISDGKKVYPLQARGTPALASEVEAIGLNFLCDSFSIGDGTAAGLWVYEGRVKHSRQPLNAYDGGGECETDFDGEIRAPVLDDFLFSFDVLLLSDVGELLYEIDDLEDEKRAELRALIAPQLAKLQSEIDAEKSSAIEFQ